MTDNLQIHFMLDGKNYDVALEESRGLSSQNHVMVGGVEYSLQGDKKGVEIIQDLFRKLPQDSTENLSQAGKELKAKLWLAGAKYLNLSTAEGVHKIGLRKLTDNAPVDIPQTINTVCLEMEKRYILPDIAKKCGEFLHAQLQQGAYDAISDLESFAEAVTADLRQISEDKHIYVFIKGPEETPKKDPDYPHPALTGKTVYKASTGIGLMGGDHLPYELEVGILAGDSAVGYMNLRIFGVCKERDDSLEMKEDVAKRRQAYLDAVDQLKGVDTIIIDLRKNGGGDPFAVQLLCSLFLDEGRPLNRIEWRTEEGPISEDFNTLSNAELPQEKRLLDKKIYVLIGPSTFSAAEEFSNNMKVLERATFVGEPSAGGAHPATCVDIGGDLELQIPIGRAINPVQQGNWEGVGIIPDHMVPAAEAFDAVVALIHNKKVV